MPAADPTPALTTHAVEPLEPRTLLAGSPLYTVADAEQLMVYLINRARHDPAAYQAEAGLPDGLLDDVAAQPPLAVNPDLFESSGFHAQEMADHNYFAHQSAVTGDWPNKMIRDTGYNLPDLFASDNNFVESIAAGFANAPAALKALILDENTNPPGHRIHLLAMNDFFQDHREIGVGFAHNNGSDFKDYWSIHTAFASDDNSPHDFFLTGVVYADANANGRYDLGEGLGGVDVSDGDLTTTTNSAGGWSIKAPPGAYTVTASGGPFAGTSTATLTSTENTEVDFISGQADGVVGFAGAPGADTHAPTATLTSHDNAVPGGATLQFQVTYADDTAVSVATLDGSDLVVQGPGGASLPAVLVSVDAIDDGTPRLATYQFDAPGGAWDAADKGTYIVRLQAGQVSDTSGNFAAEGSLGSFQVSPALPSDLTAAFGTLKTPEVLVPGDRVAAAVVVRNDGEATAKGRVAVRLFASTDATLDESDIPLGDPKEAPLNLGQGASATVRVKPTVPDTLADGASYFLIAKVDGQGNIDESDTGNNTAASPAALPVALGFGRLAGRSAPARLVLRDAAGTPVSFAIRGAGSATATATPDGFDVVVTGTDAGSVLGILAAGGAGSVLHSLTVDGPARALLAPNLSLHGDATFAGGLAALVMGDAAGGTLTLGAPAAAGTAAKVALGQVSDFAIDSQTPLKALTAADWTDTDDTPDRVAAPWARSVTVRGDFGADLELSDTGVAVSLGRLRVAGAILEAEIRAARAIGAVTAGAMDDSLLFSGVAAAVDEPPASAGAFDPVGSRIGSVTLKGLASHPDGAFSNSVIAARRVGRAILASVDTSNDGLGFGLAATGFKLVKRLDAGPLVLRNLDAPEDSVTDGDFTVSVLPAEG